MQEKFRKRIGSPSSSPPPPPVFDIPCICCSGKCQGPCRGLDHPRLQQRVLRGLQLQPLVGVHQAGLVRRPVEVAAGPGGDGRGEISGRGRAANEDADEAFLVTMMGSSLSKKN